MNQATSKMSVVYTKARMDLPQKCFTVQYPIHLLSQVSMIVFFVLFLFWDKLWYCLINWFILYFCIIFIFSAEQLPLLWTQSRWTLMYYLLSSLSKYHIYTCHTLHPLNYCIQCFVMYEITIVNLNMLLWFSDRFVCRICFYSPCVFV